MGVERCARLNGIEGQFRERIRRLFADAVRLVGQNGDGVRGVAERRVVGYGIRGLQSPIRTSAVDVRKLGSSSRDPAKCCWVLRNSLCL